MDEELVEFVFDFAKKNGVTVTLLITEFFQELRRKEESRLSQDAEQI